MGSPHQPGNAPENDESRRLRCALALLVDWQAPEFSRFLEEVNGDVAAWLSADDGEADGFDFLSRGQKRQLSQVRLQGAEALLTRAGAWPGRVLLHGDEAYPERLNALESPPAALHVEGRTSLVLRMGVAVVGSRKVGIPLAKSAQRILTPSLRRGLVLFSGGALGADAVGHRCAVDVGAATVAVLPSGLRRLSPKSNRRLFAKIVEGRGALVSEYAPDQGVRKYHFRRRNTIIAALSLGVLVLRAAEKSGTMLTVEAARKLGRPLAAVPGPPDDPLSCGCHQILRQGGRLVATDDDLLQWWRQLDPKADIESPKKSRQGRLPILPDCAVLQAATGLVAADGAFSLECLVRSTGKTSAELQALLLTHELAGVVERVGGERYRIAG